MRSSRHAAHVRCLVDDFLEPSHPTLTHTFCWCHNIATVIIEVPAHVWCREVGMGCPTMITICGSTPRCWGLTGHQKLERSHWRKTLTIILVSTAIWSFVQRNSSNISAFGVKLVSATRPAVSSSASLGRETTSSNTAVKLHIWLSSHGVDPPLDELLISITTHMKSAGGIVRNGLSRVSTTGLDIWCSSKEVEELGRRTRSPQNCIYYLICIL